MAKSNEAFWWFLFSAGGMVAAMAIPALIFTTGLLVPLSDAVSYERLHGLVSPWWARAAIVAVLFFCFLHCAHRIRHTLVDLGVHGARSLVALVCYGGAFAGAVATGLVLF